MKSLHALQALRHIQTSCEYEGFLIMRASWPIQRWQKLADVIDVGRTDCASGSNKTDGKEAQRKPKWPARIHPPESVRRVARNIDHCFSGVLTWNSY